MDSEASFPQLLVQAAWLRRFARALVGDADQAEDVAQAALIAAWRQPPPADVKARPWLARVARNQALDLKRGERRRGAREGEAEAPAAPASPEQLIGDLQIHRTVAEEVSALEEPYRQVLVLRYYDGLDASAIAARLQIPAGTVRWRLKEGLERVRVRLDRRHGGERQRWVAALLPLVPRSKPPARPRAGVLVAAGGMVALTAVLGTVVFATRRPPSAGATGATTARAVALARETSTSAVSRPAPPKLRRALDPIDDETPPWTGSPEALMKQMLTALSSGAYDAFLAHAADGLKATLRTETFTRLTAELGEPLRHGYVVESWGTFLREGTLIHLYKIAFSDPNVDDLLVQMSLEGGRVGLFVLQ